MSKKTIFGLLVIEVLICFLPITAFWVFGVCMMVMVVASPVLFFPVSCLVILGGVGLTGLFQVMKHIYRFGFIPAESTIHTKLYIGVVTLGLVALALLFSSNSSLELLVSLLPVICGIHLVYLTRSERTDTKNSVHDDQAI